MVIMGFIHGTNLLKLLSTFSRSVWFFSSRSSTKISFRVIEHVVDISVFRHQCLLRFFNLHIFIWVGLMFDIQLIMADSSICPISIQYKTKNLHIMANSRLHPPVVLNFCKMGNHFGCTLVGDRVDLDFIYPVDYSLHTSAVSHLLFINLNVATCAFASAEVTLYFKILLSFISFKIFY